MLPPFQLWVVISTPQKDLHAPLAVAFRKKCLDEKPEARLGMGSMLPPARCLVHRPGLLSKQQDYSQSPEWFSQGPADPSLFSCLRDLPAPGL